MSRRTAAVTITLPKPLVREIDRWVGKRGYRSRAELVKEAVRFRLERLRKHQQRMRAK
jgi:Arc/MetJ-type ribon-helix-helix transcriptional regulator